MPQGTPIKHKKKSKSVLKNIRQTETRTIMNRVNRTRVRSAIRRLRAAWLLGMSRRRRSWWGLPFLRWIDRFGRISCRRILLTGISRV